MLANAVYQSARLALSHRIREQARSHIYQVPLGTVLSVELEAWLGASPDLAPQHQHRRAKEAIQRHLVHAVQ